jgi:hypothetical protein
MSLSAIWALRNGLSRGDWMQAYRLNGGFGKHSVAFVICMFLLIEALPLLDVATKHEHYLIG